MSNPHMPEPFKFSEQDYRRLVLRRFPLAYEPKYFSPEDRDASQRHEQYIGQAAQYLAQLRSKTPQELAALLEEDARNEAAKRAEAEIRSEDGYFFSLSEAQADFHFWSRAACWTLEEAVALTFGRDPRKVSWAILEEYVDVAPFAKRYRDVRDLALRAYAMKRLEDPLPPQQFIDWARSSGIDFSRILEVFVEAWNKIQSDLKADQKDGTPPSVTVAAPIMELSPRERASMLKLIIGMAIKGYTYDPKAKRNRAVAEIAGDLDLLGIGLHEDTVRQYLQEASQLLAGKPE